MGFFSRKSETPSVDELLGMDDSQLRKVIKSGQVPQKSPKELRKAAQELRRKTSGEIGLGALAAGFKGGGSGSKNYQNIPLKDRVHPAEYQRILREEAKKLAKKKGPGYFS